MHTPTAAHIFNFFLSFKTNCDVNEARRSNIFFTETCLKRQVAIHVVQYCKCAVYSRKRDKTFASRRQQRQCAR